MFFARQNFSRLSFPHMEAQGLSRSLTAGLA
jgi:hypothetical protein